MGAQFRVTAVGTTPDRVEPVPSTEALGRKLELPESPAVVLARCFEGQPTVLVVDQLDFVSATSGRNPDFFETLAALVDEVRGLRLTNRIHLILACRQFDFDNDHRFRSLVGKEDKQLSVPPLTELEVKNVIEASGGNMANLTGNQIKLLQLPQNLVLFTESGLAKEKAPAFVSQNGLFDAYWEAKRRAISLQRPNEAAQWKSVIETLTIEMSNNQELSVPKARLDEFSLEFLGAMASQGVLTFDGRRYGFTTSDPQANAVIYALQSEIRRIEKRLQNFKAALADAGDYDLEAVMRTGKLVRVKAEAPGSTSLEIIEVLRRLLASEHLIKFGIKIMHERLIAVDRNGRVFMEKADFQRLMTLLQPQMQTLPAPAIENNFTASQ